MTKHITIALTDAQEAHLSATAEREAVSLETVVSEIVQGRLEYDLRFRAAVEEGLAEVRAGHVVSHEDVVRRAKQRADRMFETE